MAGPGSTDAASSDLSFLNVNESLSALACGRFHPELKRDVLAFGTRSMLVGYDVLENVDIMSKDVEDGVHSMVVGRITADPTPLVIVGGSYSLQGFDHRGTERYWTVCGDNVTSLALCDVEGDGVCELLAGSEDYEIRIYKGDAVLSEITETQRIVELADISQTQYGFALADGSIGVYRRTVREWRTQTAKIPTAQVAFDLNGDGEKELVTGYSDGSLDVRRRDTGALVYEDQLDDEVAKLLVADYRDLGEPQLVCCSTAGMLRGFKTERPTALGRAGPASGALAVSLGMTDETAQSIELLLKEKEDLTRQLDLYREHAFKSQLANAGRGNSVGEVPPDTTVTMELEPNYAGRTLDLVINVSSPRLVVQCVVVSSPLLFDGGVRTFCTAAEPFVRIALQPRLNTFAGLTVSAVVGPRGAETASVFEQVVPFPKFGLHLPVDSTGFTEPNAGVVLNLRMTTARVVLWLTSRFIFGDFAFPDKGDLVMAFSSLRDGSVMFFKFFEAKGRMHLRTSSMDLAGDLVQDLAEFNSLDSLESLAEFPDEFAAFSETLAAVDAFQATRSRMTSDLAETANLIKSLVVRGEDARVVADMPAMRAAYQALNRVNRDVVADYAKRESNHRELLAQLKQVNAMIQRASRLRVGKPSAEMVAQCRSALKDSNPAAIIRLISYGAAGVGESGLASGER